MKAVIASMILASAGTCSVGGTTKIPPSPAEQQAAQTVAPAARDTDPLAIVSPECKALGEPCDECVEVEVMRRKIEYKKCVPVCESYIEQADALTGLPQAALDELHGPQACGKGEETCTPGDELRCEYMVGYVTSGALFRDQWRTKPPADDVLAQAVYDGLLAPMLAHHSRVLLWASRNEIAPAPMLVRGGDMFGIVAQDIVSSVSTRLAAAQDPRAAQLMKLVELARFPGDPATFEERRKAAEAPMLAP